MTTVGYGDTFPVTPAGKLVACVTMLGGILVLAFPISILGTNFSDEWKALQQMKQKEERRMKNNTNYQIPIPKLLKRVDVIHNEIRESIDMVLSELQKIQEKNNEMEILIDNLRTKQMMDDAEQKKKKEENA